MKEKLWSFLESPLTQAGLAVVITAVATALGISAILVIAWLLFSSAIFRTNLFSSKSTMRSVVLCCLLALALFVLKYYLFPQSRSATAGPPDPAKIQSAQNTPPTLGIRCEESRLPIIIPQNSTAYILKLHPAVTRGLVEKQSASGSLHWPNDVRLDDERADQIYQCELSNFGDKAVLNVETAIPTSFWKPQEVSPQGVTRTKNPREVYIEFQPDIHFQYMVTTIAKGSRISKVVIFQAGALVKAFTNPISLPSILPGKSEKLYLVNQSNEYIAGFKFPTDIEALVAGNQSRQVIPLTKQQGLQNGEMISPARHKWKGDPNCEDGTCTYTFSIK